MLDKDNFCDHDWRFQGFSKASFYVNKIIFLGNFILVKK